MEVVKGKEEVIKEVMGNQPEKLSYEEVVDAANQVEQQNTQLKKQNEEMYHMIMGMKQDQSILRLNFLMDIVTNREAFSTTMVAKCVKEIEDGLFPSKEEQE